MTAMQKIDALLSAQQPLQIIAQGISPEVLDLMMQAGLKQQEANLIVNMRTLSRRKSSGHLSTEESDRVITYWFIMRKAINVFQDEDKAFRWLRSTKNFLNGLSAMEVLNTTQGAKIIEERLISLEHGIF